MRGYTKDQLAAKGAKLTNYVLCDRCDLYWHTRVFQKHLNPPAQKGTKLIEIMSPAAQGFFDFLVSAVVRQWQSNVEAGVAPEEASRIALDTPSAILGSADGEPSDDVDELVTVDEAVARYGFSRDELLASFRENMEPFEVVLTDALRAPPKAKRAPRKRTRS